MRKALAILSITGVQSPDKINRQPAGLTNSGTDRERKHEMKPPENMIEIINRRRYSVANSTLLAGNDYWDGHNFERQGRNAFLYKTQLGAYFTVNLSQWQGEQDALIPCSQDEAIEHFEEMTEHRVTFAEAFPDVEVLDA